MIVIEALETRNEFLCIQSTLVSTENEKTLTEIQMISYKSSILPLIEMAERVDESLIAQKIEAVQSSRRTSYHSQPTSGMECFIPVPF